MPPYRCCSCCERIAGGGRAIPGGARARASRRGFDREVASARGRATGRPGSADGGCPPIDAADRSAAQPDRRRSHASPRSGPSRRVRSGLGCSWRTGRPTRCTPGSRPVRSACRRSGGRRSFPGVDFGGPRMTRPFVDRAAAWSRPARRRQQRATRQAQRATPRVRRWRWCTTGVDVRASVRGPRGTGAQVRGELGDRHRSGGGDRRLGVALEGAGRVPAGGARQVADRHPGDPLRGGGRHRRPRLPRASRRARRTSSTSRIG